jgi:hypothetical protein
VLPVLLVLAASFAAPVSADTLVWRVKSEHPNSVSLEFYSQDRNAAWPGGGEVYVIKDWEIHNYRLDCRSGEQICFGAWVRNDTSSYWGAGYNGDEACESCCVTCGNGQTDVQVLKP